MKKLLSRGLAVLGLIAMVGIGPVAAFSSPAGANPILLYVTITGTHITAVIHGDCVQYTEWIYWTDHWVGGSTTSGVTVSYPPGACST